MQVKQKIYMYIIWLVMIMNKKLILFLLLIPSMAWWNTNWNYSKSLTANKGVSLFTGQFKLNTETLITAGKVKHDCGDLRIIESNSIAYYLVGCNKTYSQVFFDVDYSGNDFNMYYGNPSASSTATTSFFSFYDGFSGYVAGSDGSPTWSIKTGSFNVNYTNSSWRYVLNTSSESIATAYTPSGNFTVFVETSDSGTGKPGIIYSYINSTHYSAVYLDGTSVMIRENISSRSLGSFTINDFNHILLEIIDSTVNVYVNGDSKGSGIYYPGSVGLYALPSSSSQTIYDEFIIHNSDEVTWSLGSEQSIPALTYEFIGSENANMRTLIAHMNEGENLVKFTLETQEITGIVDNNEEAYLDWAYINFNSSGYFVNSTFFKIDADSFNYTQGEYRFDLTYSKTTAQYKKWHIVQFFNDFSSIKHIIFMTANQSGTYSPDLFPWTSCTGYVNTTGNGTCSSNMHSSAGIFHFGDVDFCGIHYGRTNPSEIYDNIDMVKFDNYKKVFWQSYDGCDKFTEETNLICGVDFYNCTATNTKPAKTLFYVNDEPHSL